MGSRFPNPGATWSEDSVEQASPTPEALGLDNQQGETWSADTWGETASESDESAESDDVLDLETAVSSEFEDGQISLSSEFSLSGRSWFDSEDDADESEEASSAPVKRASSDVSLRYEDRGQLGEGGMGEVRRVFDRDLNRTVAMKLMRASVKRKPSTVLRFLHEAQVGAQLQHPGIMPVYDVGELSDGQLYFTMREVRGRTLRDVISDVHRGDGGPFGWTFRGLVDAFARACEAMAYSHARGVVHRDLKPDNVMVGEFGEVLVLDWGLAKVSGQTADLAIEDGRLDPIQTERMLDASMQTRVGTVNGTPAFMPPEQARGEVQRLGPPADVYALGAILYTMLCDRPPYASAASAWDILTLLRQGQRPRPVLEVAQRRLPEELVELCERSMQPDPTDRFSTAAELAVEVRAWLDGARKREKALALVEEASDLGPRVAYLRAKSKQVLSTST